MIIDRTTGMSNLAMWERCELLKKILDTKVERTIGRGKAIIKQQVNKYQTHPDKYNKINNKQ